MKGGIFLAQGADTCVYDPPVECKPGTQNPTVIEEGDYVSRLVVNNDREVANQQAVKQAIQQISATYPGIDVARYFNLAVGQCVPQLKESDLKNTQGKYCTASQRKVDSIEKGDTYVNLITPRQQDDMYKLPTEFVREKLPALLHAVVYLNDQNVIHSDAHAANIAKMGDRLVLHDWGRVIVGLRKFKQKMIMLLQNPYEKTELQKFAQWRFPCTLLDACILPNSNDDTFLKFMKMYDVVSIMGSVQHMNLIDNTRLINMFYIASYTLTDKSVPSTVMLPLLHDMIDYVFSSGPMPPALELYMPPSRRSAIPNPPQLHRDSLPELSQSLSPIAHQSSSAPLIEPRLADSDLGPRQPTLVSPPRPRPVPRLILPPQARGGAKATAKKLCKCIKSVRKTIKARPGISKEKGAIAICVKSIVQTKRRTLKKFKCGKKPRLVTQKRKRVGGATHVPDDVAWDRFMEAYDYDAKPYDRQIWGALKQNSEIRYVPTTSGRFFLRGALLFGDPELIETMHTKGAKYSDFVNALDELRTEYGTNFSNDLTRAKEIIQKYQRSL